MRLVNNLFRNAVALTLAAAVVGGVAHDARACGGAWYPYIEVDYKPQMVARAEKAMDKGNLVAAAGIIIRVIPHLKDIKPTKSKIIERAHRVLAVATARYEGQLPVGLEVPGYAQGTWLGKTEENRQANLEWAITSLRALTTSRKNDPALETDLAEALAKVGSHKGEAREILERLAQKDLVATPEAYAVLADLRAASGDEQGTKLALSRCEAMAKSTGVCRSKTTAAS